MKLLLVDDDVFLRDMYTTKFTEHGHEVVGVDSGSAAITALTQSSAYDVVLLDMVMPGMSGGELIKEISERFGDKAPPCIVLSNQGQQEDVDEANQAGAIGYIIKAEVIPSEVVTRVETYLEQLDSK